MARKDYGAIPIANANIQSLTEHAGSVKQAIDVLTGQTRNRGATAVTWDDLVSLGLVENVDATNLGRYLVQARSGAKRLACINNSGTPNTLFDCSADEVVLRNSNGYTTMRVAATGTVTCNVGTAGPVANGRDQSAAFSASSWVHFWWIAKVDGTIATIASASADAPSLPSEYTHYAYIGAVYFDGSSHLRKTGIRGSRAYYVDAINDALVINGGSSTSEATVSLTGYIPPNAIDFQCDIYTASTSTAAARSASFGVVSGLVAARMFVGWAPAGGVSWGNAYPLLVNINQTMYYSVDNNAAIVYAFVINYSLPNGST